MRVGPDSHRNRAFRVFLVRHGRTAMNAEGRLRGLADPEIDPVGLDEAGRVADALIPRRVRAVRSSPLRRAVATALVIAKATGAVHTVDRAFNDRDYGEWTGHRKVEVVAEWGSVDAAPGVEPTAVVLDRALRGLDRLPADPAAGPIVIVTHDAVIRPILTELDPGIEPQVPTGSWAELVRIGDSWAIESFDNLD